MSLRFLTGGESHGPALVALLDGLPRGVPVDVGFVNRDLERRQGGHGRGGRMLIEKDTITILSGVRHGVTTGAPVTLLIHNRDHENWRDVMSVDEQGGTAPETRPRPGHGDLAGMLKYGVYDARDVLERASARESAARVAAGAVCKALLSKLGVYIASRVVMIGAVGVERSGDRVLPEPFLTADEDPVRCGDAETSVRMVAEIDNARSEGDTLGGVFEVAAFGVVPGLGSYVQADRRLDGKIASALMSIPGIKGVEIGAGFGLAARRGSGAHDEIRVSETGSIERPTNRAGGIEAGVTNGEPLLATAAMKPIPTLGKPVATVDLATGEPAEALKERADVCAVPAASVVGEAAIALVLAGEVIEKFGGDSIEDLESSHARYLERISDVWRPGASR